MPTAHEVEVPSPPAPAPSPPLPEPGQACPETAGAVARANEAGGLEEDADAVSLTTPKQVMTPRDLTATNETNEVLKEDDDDEDGGEEGNLSDDESYTPSVGEESDDDDDDQTEWRLQPIKSSDFSIGFNVTDRRIEEKYLQETKALSQRLLDEFASISRSTVRRTRLTEDELLNTFFPAESAVPVLAFMNRNLLARGKTLITFQELQPFMRSFIGLCYYKKQVADIKAHPEAFPIVVNEVENIVGITFDEKVDRLNDLLRSWDGHDVKRKRKDRDDEVLTFDSVYRIDRELEKLFRDLGGHASRLAHIEGVTDMMIDDEKTRTRSALVALLSLARSKSGKAFGAVGNCINSMWTGIPLATHYSHFGESCTDIVMSLLSIISGSTSHKSIDMKETTLGGDRGYNDNEYFEKSAAANLNNIHTTKRGPSLPVTFGNTKYKTSREQRVIPESGPMLSLGATRAVGGTTSHMTAYRNGTNRVTLLQTTMPTMTYGNFDYVTEYQDFDYAKKFEEAATSGYKKDDYDPVELLNDEEAAKRLQYDRQNVYEHTKRGSGIEWLNGRGWTLTSTVSHEVLPREETNLTLEQKNLLRDDLGRKLISPLERDESEEYLKYAEGTHAELKKLGKQKLIEICKQFKRPYSNKNMDKLIEQIQLGPVEVAKMTEQEMFIKKTFLAPLSDSKERTAWKLGSMNEDNVRGVVSGVVKGVGGELEDVWECGLLRSKSHQYIATSLDAWLRIKVKASEARVDEDIDCDDDSTSIPPEWEAPQPDPDRLVSINCGLEIKTPSGKKVLRDKVAVAKELHGTFSTCEFGSRAFKKLVYDASYRTQLLHHATVCNFSHMLFVVASETGIRYATLVHVPKAKRLTYLTLLEGVYDRCLKWAYEDAWDSNDPIAHIPDIRPEVVSGSNYPIDIDSIAVKYIIWKMLFQKVRRAQLPLPLAKKILPVIITMWNRAKGRIDEMTRHIDSMLFDLPKGSPKQRLVMREMMKLCLSVYFSKKHCFPSKPVPKGQGYTKIQVHLWHLRKEFTLKEVLLKLATTYTVRNQIKGFIPGSPMPGTTAKETEENRGDESDDSVEMLSQRGVRSWQSQAMAKIRSIEGKRNKFNLFCQDEMLDRIRCDYRLNHSQISIADISRKKKKKDAETGVETRQASTDTGDAAGVEGDATTDNTEETNKAAKKSVRKHSSPRCVLCVGLMGAQKAYQTVFSCRACGVYLCITPHGASKKTCFEKWHGVKDLSALKKNNSVNAGVKKSVRTSPRKKTKSTTGEESGSAVTSDGVRRSLRKRSAPPSNELDC